MISLENVMIIENKNYFRKNKNKNQFNLKSSDRKELLQISSFRFIELLINLQHFDGIKIF